MVSNQLDHYQFKNLNGRKIVYTFQLTIKNLIPNNILEMCTGNFYESGRPPIYSKCTKPCIHEVGRWGASWCDIKDGNWGAPCVSCPGNCKINVLDLSPFNINIYSKKILALLTAMYFLRNFLNWFLLGMVLCNTPTSSYECSSTDAINLSGVSEEENCAIACASKANYVAGCCEWRLDLNECIWVPGAVRAATSNTMKKAVDCLFIGKNKNFAINFHI